MVATGSTDGAIQLSSTEVIDLADESTTCEAIEDYPIPVGTASGGLASLPIICGGRRGNSGPISECYIAGKKLHDPVAKLLTPRFGSAAVAISSHQLWITGGVDGVTPLSSTEIVNVQASYASVEKGPELPEPMVGHCIVQLNLSTVLFMGGGPSTTKKTFFYEMTTQTWTNGPDMNYGRAYFGCGLMQTATGSSIVVVSGGGTSLTDFHAKTEFLPLDETHGMKGSAGALNPFHGPEFFFLSQGMTHGLKWSVGAPNPYHIHEFFCQDIFILGPDLPIPLFAHQMVNFDGSVVAIGGGKRSGHSDALFKLLCSTKGECEWKKMSQKLTVARDFFVAMTIPDEMANCRAKVRTKV